MSFAITGKKVGIQTPAHTIPLRPQGKPKPPTIHPKTSTQPKPTIQSKPLTTTKDKPLSDHLKGAQQKKQTEKVSPKVEESQAEKKAYQVKPQQMETIKQETAKQQDNVNAQQEVWSEITIRYNHYKEKFPMKNGVLSFVPIEDKYSFSDLFKGNYQPVLKVFKTHQVIEPISRGLATDFTWKLQEGIEYRLEIQEDEEEEAKYEKKVYKAPAAEPKCPCKKNQRVQEINALLKQLKPEQFGSAKHRELLEQRDLQDVLYT